MTSYIIYVWADGTWCSAHKLMDNTELMGEYQQVIVNEDQCPNQVALDVIN